MQETRCGGIFFNESNLLLNVFSTIILNLLFCRWCRCIVMSQSGSKVQLLSVDYGRMFQARIDEISDMPSSVAELTLLPCQAIECHMATVIPVGSEWTDNAGNLVWDECGNSLSLFAKVGT